MNRIVLSLLISLFCFSSYASFSCKEWNNLFRQGTSAAQVVKSGSLFKVLLTLDVDKKSKELKNKQEQLDLISNIRKQEEQVLYMKNGLEAMALSLQNPPGLVCCEKHMFRMLFFAIFAKLCESVQDFADCKQRYEQRYGKI